MTVKDGDAICDSRVAVRVERFKQKSELARGATVVPAAELIVDPAEIDFSNVLADIDEIRRYIPQRFAMEQLTSNATSASATAI
jgi:hypothetical protein